MTPGENELAKMIGELAIERAQLMNRLQIYEMSNVELQKQLEETREHLTPAARKKLNLDGKAAPA